MYQLFILAELYPLYSIVNSDTKKLITDIKGNSKKSIWNIGSKKVNEIWSCPICINKKNLLAICYSITIRVNMIHSSTWMNKQWFKGGIPEKCV